LVFLAAATSSPTPPPSSPPSPPPPPPPSPLPTAWPSTAPTPHPHVATPVFDPADGTSAVMTIFVRIDCETPGAVIRYTNDGSEPNESAAPLTPGSGFYWSHVGTTLFRARAFRNGFVPSEVAAAAFTVQAQSGDPAISPAGGTFVGAVTIVLTCESPGARLYYSLDGGAVAPDDEGALSVASGETLVLDTPGTFLLRVVAVSDDMAPSDTVSAEFTVRPRAEAPHFSPELSTFPLSAVLLLSTPTEGATIYYTDDGSEPSASSVAGGSSHSCVPAAQDDCVLYCDTVGVTVYKAIASAPGFEDSVVSTKVIHIQDRVSRPYFDPALAAAEAFVTAVDVRIFCDTPNATIHYVVSRSGASGAGLVPGPGKPGDVSVKPGEPIHWDALGTATFRAVAVRDGWVVSQEVHHTFTVVEPAYDTWPLPPRSWADGSDAAVPLVDVRGLSRTFASEGSAGSEAGNEGGAACGAERRVSGRVVRVQNPAGHVSMIEPVGGCGGVAPLLASSRAYRPPAERRGVAWPGANATHVARRSRDLEAEWEAFVDSSSKGCTVALPTGVFNSSAGSACGGLLVSNGLEVAGTGGGGVDALRLGFGIANGSWVVGRVSDVKARFDHLLEAEAWIVRRGDAYAQQFLDSTAGASASVALGRRSARTALGYDSEGRLLLLHVEGEVTLDELAILAADVAFVSAVSLAGAAASSSLALDGTLVSHPSMPCIDQETPLPGDGVWQCERPVSAVVCVHAAAPPFLTTEQPASGGGSGGETDDATIPAPSPPPSTAPPASQIDDGGGCGGSEPPPDVEGYATLQHDYEALLRKYENLTSAALGGASDDAAVMFYRAASGALLLALMLSGWVHYKDKTRPQHGRKHRGYGPSARGGGASFGAYSQVSNGNGVVGIEMPALGWNADDDEFPDPNAAGSRPTTGSVLRKIFAPPRHSTNGGAWTSMSVKAVSAQPDGWARDEYVHSQANGGGGSREGNGTREVDMAFNPFLGGTDTSR